MSIVELVWATPDAEALITKMARVSAPANENNMETAPKLLRYLIKHSHWSPFEMANMCVEIHTTRAISAQIIRHRSFSFQEFSQRYADINLLGSTYVPHLRRQDTKNRQNSIDDLDAELTGQYYRRISTLFEEAEHLYKEMVSKGVAKECARNILPLASPTRIYMNGSLRSWITYIALREKHGTQMEHMQIAKDAKKIFCGQFPTIAEALGGSDDWILQDAVVPSSHLMDGESLKDVALACWLDIVYGGQDTREYTNSLRVIRQALEHVPEKIKYKQSTKF